MILDFSKIKTLRNYFHAMPFDIHNPIFGKIETKTDIDLYLGLAAERYGRDISHIFMVYSSVTQETPPVMFILKCGIHELLDGVVDYRLVAGTRCTKKNYLRVDDIRKALCYEKFIFYVRLDFTEADLAMMALKAETELQVQFVEFLTAVFFTKNSKK